jgi:succinoglycan biosynthesis transport protein ExoP
MLLNDGQPPSQPMLPHAAPQVPVVSAHVPLAAIDRPGRVDPATVAGLWSLIRRHRWTVAIGVIIMVVVVGLFTFLIPPRWEAVAAIRLEDTKVDLPDLVTRIGQDREVSTEQAALESRRLAEATIDSLQLRAVTTPVRVPRASLFSAIAVAPADDSGEFTFTLRQSDKAYAVHDENADKDIGVVKPGGTIALPGVTVTVAPGVTEDQFTLDVTSRDVAVERFSKTLKVDRPDRDANVLTLTYRGTDKTLVRDVPNVLAGLFIADRNSQHKVEAKSTAKVLAQQLDSVQRQLAASESELETFRTQNNIVSLPDEATSDVNHLAELQADRNTVGAERDALSSLMSDVTAQAARQRPDQPSPYRRLIAFPTLLKNNAASELLASLATVEDERTALLERRTAKDPDVLTLTARIEQIDQQLKSIGQTYLQGLNNQVAADDSVLRISTAKMRTIPAKEIEFTRLSRQPKVLEDIYTTLQTRLKEAQVSAAVVDPSVYVMDPAVLPHKPVMPRPVLYMAASIILGLMLGIGLAMANEARDHTIHTRADVLAATGSPVLGLIPRINLGDEFMSRLRLAEELGPPGTGGRRRLTGKRRSFTGPHLNGNGSDSVLVTDPSARNAVAEAYSTLQTNLAFIHPGGELKTIVFTSPLSGDGKTTSATNLAVTLVQRGHSVLLVDADLRRGVINRVFGSNREPGLSDILQGTTSVEAALRRVDLGRAGSLHYLTTGALPHNPASLIDSPAMRTLMERLKQHYDTIILDSPPINVVTDAALIGAHADGVVVVVRSGVTAVQALMFAMEQLRHVRAPVLGAVLNDIDFHRDAAYDGAYRFQGHRDRYYMAEA